MLCTMPREVRSRGGLRDAPGLCKKKSDFFPESETHNFGSTWALKTGPAPVHNFDHCDFSYPVSLVLETVFIEFLCPPFSDCLLFFPQFLNFYDILNFEIPFGTLERHLLIHQVSRGSVSEKERCSSNKNQFSTNKY